ncbi:MAG: hypothetical protein mread185_000178 [Mycoplasmataceae bacterium]|nr:MAG: hypothetical protein mread185_000178 [Mycoplasmataceae bacterium]
MIQLESKHRQIVNSILNKYPYTFYAYGSRAKGTHWKYSDLDLCYQESIPDHIAFVISEEFKESDLPFKVDLVDWKRMNSDFQNLIKKDLVSL